MTGLIFTLVWFPLVGLAVSRVVGRGSIYLYGTGVTGVALYIAGALHLPLKVGAIALAIASVAVLAVKRPRIAFTKPHSPIPTAITIAMSLALLFVTAIVPLTDYDGRAFWLLKAKAIAHEGAIDGPLFQGQSADSPRNTYPLLLPLDAALVMRVARELDERHTRWLFAFFAIAFALEVRRRFSEWFSPALGAWFGAFVLLLPQIVTKLEGGAVSGYNDVAFAAFVACALFEIIDGTPLRLGLWIAFLPLLKNEGLPFALVLFAVGAYVFRKRIAVAAAPLGVALATLFLWRSRVERTDEENIFHDLVTRLPERLGRSEEAFSALARHATAWQDWGLLWMAVLVAIVILAARRDWRTLALCLGAILPMLALYVVTWMVMNWNTTHIADSSAPRLLAHFVGPALYLLARATEGPPAAGHGPGRGSP